MIKNKMKWFAVIALLGLLALGGLFFAFKKKSPPNVLLVTIDTLRADHLGCYGYQRKITPNLDALASRGILFENAFTVMPTTVPSHGSMLFGTWPRIHGSLSNSYHFSNKSLDFLPEILSKGGYSTAAFLGITHLYHAMRAVHGFQTIQGPDSNEIRTAEKSLAMAHEWLKQKKPSRFFLWVHLWEPHFPYDLHPEFMKQIDPDFINDVKERSSFMEKDVYTKQEIKKMIELYDNEIAYADHQLGLFLETLRKESMLDNTIIIVTADHGESLDEILETEGYAFDHGEFLYDPQLHVPLIVVLPHSEKKGLRIRQTVTLLDLMPTVLQACGLRAPSSAQGLPLQLTLNNQQHPSRLVYLQRGKYSTPRKHPYMDEQLYGVRNDRFKLIITEDTHQSFLYENFHEGKLVSNDRVQQELEKSLQAWLKMTDRFKSRKSIQVSPEESEQLKALGYVQ